MGIFSRISKLLESNLSALVDRAEDPAKLLDQAIDDMKKGQREAKEAIIKAMTEKRLIERRYDKAKEEEDAAERRAMQALKDGDEELAKRCVTIKIQAGNKASAELSAIEEQAHQIDQLVAAEAQLAQRLQQLPARRAALVARQSAAQARGAKTGTNAKAKVSAALEAFERMEEKIIRAEVEAEVASESGGMPPLELALPASTEADRALDELRNKMAGELPATVEVKVEKSPPSEASTEVEDSLADLKAKLS